MATNVLTKPLSISHFLALKSKLSVFILQLSLREYVKGIMKTTTTSHDKRNSKESSSASKAMASQLSTSLPI